MAAAIDPTGRSGSGGGPTNTQLATILGDAYKQIEDLQEQLRKERDRADYWQRYASASGPSATSISTTNANSVSSPPHHHQNGNNGGGGAGAASSISPQAVEAMQKDIYELRAARDRETARRLAMSDQWAQLRDYLMVLDQHSRDARSGLDRLFSQKGGVWREGEPIHHGALNTAPVPLVTDVNAGTRVWREKRKREDGSRSPSIDEMILEAADQQHQGGGAQQQQQHAPSRGGSYQTHVFAPVVTGAPPAKRAKFPPGVGASTQHIPYPTNMNGAAPPHASVPPQHSSSNSQDAPARTYPATNELGQRICRSCGEPGRYKEDKCIEKWGPGPMGPGTVCDRCRKKMKRVERRNTLSSSTSSAVLGGGGGMPVPALAGNNAGAMHAGPNGSVMGRVIMPVVVTSAQQQQQALARTDTVVVSPEVPAAASQASARLNSYPNYSQDAPQAPRVISPRQQKEEQQQPVVGSDRDGEADEDADADGEMEVDGEEEEEDVVEVVQPPPPQQKQPVSPPIATLADASEPEVADKDDGRENDGVAAAP